MIPAVIGISLVTFLIMRRWILAAFIVFVPNIAESISKGLSGAVFGVLLIIVIFVLPRGARQVAQYLEVAIKKLSRT